MSKDYPVISLFAGAGGLDLGLEAAGFRIAVALEMDRLSCETLRENRPDLSVIKSPIEDVTSRPLLKAAGLKKREAALLVGGPPCQPFSKSSYWSNGDTKRLKDPRANTLTEFVRVLRDTLPQAFLLENVSGIVYKGKDEGMQHLIRLIEQVNDEARVNYQLSWRVVNMASYGVPQIRERMFLVASRDGTSFHFPEPTHFDASSGETDLFREPFRTAWDAIGDLPPEGPEEEELQVRGKWGGLLPSIPEGENYLYHTDRKGGMPLFGWRTRYWSFLLKLAKCLPSWTIQAQPGSAIGPFHWTSRRLSSREMMRIQTFPDDYFIVGGRTEVQRQLGNAVPSLMTEILGREILAQFFGQQLSSEKLSLIPASRRPVPKPERLRKVPMKYHDMIGDHAPHPGTGKGPRAFEVNS